MRLDEYAADTTSQFGQDGIIRHILDVIGEQSRLCVEFGASDGLDCSNTVALRRRGWEAVLIEADDTRFKQLEENVTNETIIHAAVEPTGSCSLDAILTDLNIADVDFMSIDVDGNDYWIWEAMSINPRVVCIEYNFTIPPHLSLVQPPGDAGFGSSVSALRDLGKRKGYTFVGLTHSDAFFVKSDEASPFDAYECDLNTLLPPDRFTYVVTDYVGRAGAAGVKPPWGIKDHLVGIDGVHVIGSNPQRVVEAYERRYNCPVLYLTVDNWLNINENSPSSPALAKLADYMRVEIPAICVNTHYVNDYWLPELEFRIKELANNYHYTIARLGDVLTIILNRVLQSGHG